MQSLKDKIAIITGGTGGLRRAMVEVFVEKGASVVIADIDSGKGQQLQQQLGDCVVFQQTDVSQAADVQAMINCAVDHLGGLHILSTMPPYPAPCTRVWRMRIFLISIGLCKSICWA